MHFASTSPNSLNLHPKNEAQVEDEEQTDKPQVALSSHWK